MHHELVDAAIQIEGVLRLEYGIPHDDFCSVLLPAAIVGYFPRSMLHGDSDSKLEALFGKLASQCSSLRVEQIAVHFGLDPRPLKKLWALADDDRTNEAIRKIEQASEKLASLAVLEKYFSERFLDADDFYESKCSSYLSKEEYLRKKRAFVSRWLECHVETLKSPKSDPEQTAAIAAVNGNVQVIARAGSGKTSTSVNRALFLVKHCGVPADEILLLAFNRKAAQEIRRRLLGLISAGAELAVAGEVAMRLRDARGRDRTSDQDAIAQAVDLVAKQRDVSLPHAMTFHALAYGVVHPEEKILSDSQDGEDLGLSRAFQEVIDDHLRAPAFQDRIREFMMLHFREDWGKIEEGGYDKTKDELLAYRRSLPRESLQGEYVKSFGEKVIADFLFEHGVPYKYERNHRWGGINYRPDFTIFKTAGKEASGVIVEYFGLAGDPDYDEMSDQKREYWKGKTGWTLLEYSPHDIVKPGRQGFRDKLAAALVELGVPCEKLSEDDIWSQVKIRAVDRFTRTMAGFVGRCRKLCLSPEALSDRIALHHSASDAEEKFLPIALGLYQSYLERLVATGQDDFDGLMQRAADLLLSGQTVFERKQTGRGDLGKLRFIFIDEYQDFSELFFRLLDAIRRLNRNVRLFCVGDDWQAINAFAGSDLRFFNNFEAFVGDSLQLAISTNYRSSQAVVAIGNALMAGRGPPAKHQVGASVGEVLLADIALFDATLIEQQRHVGDDLTPAVLRVIGDELSAGQDVVMLCRTHSIPWYVNYAISGNAILGRGLERYIALIRSFFPEELQGRISISTTHAYKGLEKHTVILLDAVKRSYPLVHPDWVFSRVLDVNLDELVAEERRLFYVGMTRAIERLVLITDGRNKSPFLDEVQSRFPLSKIDWREYVPVDLIADSLLIRIGNLPGHRIANESGGADAPTYVIREALKVSGYKFRSARSAVWEKTVSAKDFDVATLRLELWADDADGVEVTVLDGSNRVVSRHAIYSGSWRNLLIAP